MAQGKQITVSVRTQRDRQQFLLCWTDPATNRRRFQATDIPKGTRRNRDLAAKEAEALEQKLNAGTVSVGRVGWQAFRDLCDEQYVSGLAAGTAPKIDTAFNHIENHLNVHDLREIDEQKLSRLAAVWRRGKLSENTIESYFGQIRAALEWARTQRLIARVPDFPKIRRAKKSTGQPMKGRPLTDAEFAALLEVTPNVVGQKHAGDWRYYLRGLWLSGLRRAESLDLWWDADGKLYPRFVEGRHPLLIIPSECEKGHRDREYPMTPDFAAFLEETPVNLRTGPVFRLNARRGHVGRISAEQAGKVISEIGEAAGVKVWTNPRNNEIKYASAHDLRRSFGSRWALRVMPIYLKELMRHSNIATTMRYYIEVQAQELAATIWAAVGRSLPGPPPAGDGSTQQNAQQDDPAA
jgi:integrase